MYFLFDTTRFWRDASGTRRFVVEVVEKWGEDGPGREREGVCMGDLVDGTTANVGCSQ